MLTEEDFAEEPTESMISEMRSLIGSIGYCATAVRFDIGHAVSVLSRHLARPCVKVIEAAKRLADVLTKAVPLATFERLVRLCLDSKRGEYYVKLADEKMSYVSDEKTWMVTDMW